MKWRNLSTGRVSVYRYSLPAITAQKRKECSECIFKHKKLCLLGVWLSFVIFLCIIVVLGSLNPDEERGPYSRIDRTFNASLYNSNVAGWNVGINIHSWWKVHMYMSHVLFIINKVLWCMVEPIFIYILWKSRCRMPVSVDPKVARRR